MYVPTMEDSAVSKGTAAGLELTEIRVFDYMKMRDHIAEKYKIEERDYKGHFGFKWQEYALSIGATVDEASILYRTAPAKIEDDRLKDIHAKTSAASDAWSEKYPYCDFWHFMLDYFGDFHKGKPLSINWADVLEYAEEDWEKEIAQLYVNEYGDEEYVVIIDW